MTRQKTQLLLFAFLAIVIGLTASPICAASKSIQLKYAGLLPPGTTLSAPVDEWGKLVEERTGGQVKLTTFHGQSLGKHSEFPKMMKAGLCDMAWVGAGTAGFDLLGVAELPSSVASMRVSMDLMHAICRKGYFAPIFEDNGFKLMFFMNSDARMIWLSKKKVTQMSDFKGLKIRGVSPVHIDVAKALGATAVTISPADVYMALERGTVDGIMNPTEGIFAMKLYDSIKYCLWEPIVSDMTAVVMNLEVWNNFPAEIRTVFQDVNAEMKFRYLDYYKTAEEDKARIRKAGIEILELNPDQKNALYAALEPVSRDWVGKMEKKGFKGQLLFDEMRRLLKQY